MNNIKIDYYYKPESKTLRLDEVDYTTMPNSDIKPLLDKLQEKNKQLQERIEYLERSNNRREDTIFEQSQKIIDLEDKLSKIETLIINHNYDTGDIYYKYNSKFLKSELKQRILDILNEVSEWI